MSGQTTVLERNAEVHRCRGMGRWRALYLEFIRALAPRSVVELGAGDPSFLAALAEVPRRLALDGNARLARRYAEAGIEFQAFDFDRDPPPVPLEGFDVAVCSDVFEHLLYPTRALELLGAALGGGGALFSHVPNEFRLGKTVGVLLGRRTAVCHHDSEEWNDPHLRRFTDRGYRAFLEQTFRHHLKLTDLRHGRTATWVRRLGLTVPYCLEPGPTYASTNDEAVRARLEGVKLRVAATRGRG